MENVVQNNLEEQIASFITSAGNNSKAGELLAQSLAKAIPLPDNQEKFVEVLGSIFDVGVEYQKVLQERS